jgi:hypothetical protein
MCPTTPPQCVLSNVHRRFRRLVGGKWRSGAMRGLGCEAILVRWVAILSWRTSRTYGMCRSECRVWFVTYHGAFVNVLRVFYWYRWIISILECEAQPHAISDEVKRQLHVCRGFLEVNFLHTSCMSDVQIQIFRICVHENRKAACS